MNIDYYFSSVFILYHFPRLAHEINSLFWCYPRGLVNQQFPAIVTKIWEDPTREDENIK